MTKKPVRRPTKTVGDAARALPTNKIPPKPIVKEFEANVLSKSKAKKGRK